MAFKIIKGYRNPWQCECGVLLRGVTNKETKHKRNAEWRGSDIKMDRKDKTYIEMFSVFECPNCGTKNSIEDGISFFWDCIHPESKFILKEG